MEKETRRTLLLHHLPRHIIEEILSLLSVKSLITLKCVSKSLCSLISDEGFVRAHFLKSSKDPSFTRHKIATSDVLPRFSYCRRLRRRCTSTCLLDEKVAKDFVFSSAEIKRKKKWSPDARSCNTVRSSNGLLCYFSGEDFTLRNPSTRRYKKLPPVGFVKRKKYRSIISWGFGYVESTNDYKVLAISHPRRADVANLCTVKIYSLKTGSWGTICEDYIVREPTDLTARHVGGIVYWLRIYRGNSEQALRWVIISFDLEKEKFGIIIKQPHLNGKSFYAPQLGVFNGCYPCVLCIYHTPKKTDLWILKPRFWTYLPIFPKGRSRLRFDRFGVCSGGAIFRRFEPESNLFYYMPNEVCKRNLTIVDLDIFDGVCAHVESLVSLGDNSEKEEEEDGRVCYNGSVVDLEMEEYDDDDDDEDDDSDDDDGGL